MARRGKVIRFPGAPEPPSSEADPQAGDERGLVEVHRGNRAEALVIKSLLESEGIPTLLRSRFTHSVHPFTVGAQGEVVVLVPESEVVRSRVLLTRLAPGPSSP
jgi:putative signal transducing protein